MMKARLGIAAAAALLASAAGANAATYILFPDFCDYFESVRVDGDQSSAVHNLKTACSGTNNAADIGVTGAITGFTGKWLIFSDNSFDAQYGQYTGYSVYYAIQQPLQSGNSWFAFYKLNGSASVSYGSGTYVISTTPPTAKKSGLPATWQMKGQFTPAK